MSSKRKWDQAAPEEGSPPAKAVKQEDGKTASEAAAAAAAIAAKIAAQFAGSGSGSMVGGKDPHDGDYIHDIDINDVRNRYLLTKGSTQTQVRTLYDYLTGLPLTAYRFTRRLVLRSVRRVYGTLTAPRPQRRIHLCIFTSPLRHRRCFRRLSTKSTNSLPWTWVRWSRIRKTARGNAYALTHWHHIPISHVYVA